MKIHFRIRFGFLKEKARPNIYITFYLCYYKTMKKVKDTILSTGQKLTLSVKILQERESEKRRTGMSSG